ncbi:MAG: SRPBCC domain-containing protein [Bryobacterales bacterium]|nr:SRPBCC domain-containing protein [Bryobacterales bacterium]
MKTLHFAARINASPKTVWEVMIAPDTYRAWTSEFAEGSYFEGSWNKGDRICFLGPGGGGMVAVINESRPYEFLSIKHLGEIKDGVEDTQSEAVRVWAPAYENYTFSSDGAATELAVDMDVAPAWEEYMQEAWPKALAKLKALGEGN